MLLEYLLERRSGTEHQASTTLPSSACQCWGQDESSGLEWHPAPSIASFSYLPFFIALIIIFSRGPLSALRCNESLVPVVVKLITAVAKHVSKTQTAMSRGCILLSSWLSLIQLVLYIWYAVFKMRSPLFLLLYSLLFLIASFFFLSPFFYSFLFFFGNFKKNPKWYRWIWAVSFWTEEWSLRLRETHGTRIFSWPEWTQENTLMLI